MRTRERNCRICKENRALLKKVHRARAAESFLVGAPAFLRGRSASALRERVEL
jgi:hypothetical protein